MGAFIVPFSGVHPYAIALYIFSILFIASSAILPYSDSLQNGRPMGAPTFMLPKIHFLSFVHIVIKYVSHEE